MLATKHSTLVLLVLLRLMLNPSGNSIHAHTQACDHTPHSL
jgi:hypothetical protein